MQLDFQIVATYFGEITFAHFLHEMRKLSQTTQYPIYKSAREDYNGLNLFEVAYLKARNSLTSNKAFARKYSRYFQEVDSILGRIAPF